MPNNKSYPSQIFEKNSIKKTGAQMITVSQEHHVAEARQQAKRMAQKIGFNRPAIYEIATSVTELATNLLSHTLNGGLITLYILQVQEHNGIEITVHDKGPGIPDIAAALTDGFSTKNGLGSGLPGVKRLMNEFEIESEHNQGTTIITRKWVACG